MTSGVPCAARHALLDRSIPLVRAGYPYLLALRHRWQSDVLELRMLGRPATVVAGPDGARLFYDSSVLRRRGAIPRPIRNTLFGSGAVHGLDDAAHTHRKALFLRLLDPAAAKSIAELAAASWHAEHAGHPVDPVSLFGEAVAVHGAASCAWAGVPSKQVPAGLAGELAAIVDGFGSIGAAQLRAQRARRRCDRWATRLLAAVRAGGLAVPSGSALAVLADYHEPDGVPLPDRVAGVELINLLRPTVAVAYFVAFTAHALGRDPELRDRLSAAPDELYESLAHEVRRYYPFVPMLAARVRRPMSFRGAQLRPGQRVILDVYGTLHDPQLWAAADRFDAGRFVGTDPDPYLFIPQGGGDPASGHRCPGERVAIELIKVAARHLVNERPPLTRANVEIPLARFPTRPRPLSRAGRISQCATYFAA